MTTAAPTLPDGDRSTRPTPYAVVAIGGSAGAIRVLIELLALLPATFRIPILVVQHLWRGAGSFLPVVLGRSTHLAVKWAEHGEKPFGGIVYVAPFDHQMTMTEDGCLNLCNTSARVNHYRPAVDPLFESIARVFGTRVISIVLSGMLDDGMRGTAAVLKYGGVAITQSEATSEFFDMPCAATDLGGSEISFSPAKIAEALCAVGLD